MHFVSIFEQVVHVPQPQNVQKIEPAVPQSEAIKQGADVASAAPPKVDYATDLFGMLSVDGPSENSSDAAPADDNDWAGFQCMSLISSISPELTFLYLFILAVWFRLLVNMLGLRDVFVFNLQRLMKHQKLRKPVHQKQQKAVASLRQESRIYLKIHHH